MDEKEDYQHKLRLLEALKKDSKDLQSKYIPMCANPNLSTIKTFLETATQLEPILSTDQNLFKISQLFSNLITQLNRLQNSQDYSLWSFIRCRIANFEISKLAFALEAEVQAWIDQESIKNLVEVLQKSIDDEEKVKVLKRFEDRLLNGFDRDLQQIILKAKIFYILESIVSKSKCSMRVCEQSARAIVGLVIFNKDVFVGQVLMGPTIRALESMTSCGSIQILSSLVKLIKSPLVYELEENGYFPRIISLLSSEDVEIQVAALECILELVHFARKESIEGMIQQGLVKKLVDLQRLEIEDGENWGKELENSAFSSCVTRFVVQLEMSVGVEQGEKRQLKQEILKRVREASVSEAETTSIVAEILWGSSPLLH